ncbi:Protein-lysine N-methyltransferase efm6 [Malassezia yamatoensis]|uniref:Protein-lysine N-methyltransferase EFM6 n=1 Tax=Malassezia yamatoensis TaxID=253288 RepID=A0AAJ5YVI1_9BASI|nr:Protein-lysine N-methyltransferase efm6 [Malassezia yamatoensis]
MQVAWLFGRGQDSLPPSPEIQPKDEDGLILDQIASILGERAEITYYSDGKRPPVTTIEHGENTSPTVRNETQDDDPSYKILLTLNMKSGCGGTIWPAAEVLGAYIASIMTRTNTSLSSHPWRGKTIVELGSGTGLIGFLVAKIGAGTRTWITDQVPMLPLMEENAELNKRSMLDPCYIAELNWGKPIPNEVPQKPDVLLLADCVYREEAFQPLVDTMYELASKKTEILFSYQKRRKADKRFFGMLKKHFTYDHVDDDDPQRRTAYNRQGTFLMRMHLRS